LSGRTDPDTLGCLEDLGNGAAFYGLYSAPFNFDVLANP